MCVGPMGASILERRRGGGGQGAGVVYRGHVGSVCGRCTKRTVLSSVVCSWSLVARVRTSARDGRRVEGMQSKRSYGGGEVNPWRGTGEWRGRGARRVARAPSRCKCSARRKSGDGGHQWT